MTDTSVIKTMAQGFWNAYADEFNQWDTLDGKEQERLCKAQTAALRSLLDAGPTEAMTRACIRLPRDEPLFPAVFRAMLRAALEEGNNA